MIRSAALVRLSLGLACLFVPAPAWSDPEAVCKEATVQVVAPTTIYLTCDRGLKVVTASNAGIFDTAPQAKDPTAAAASVESGIVVAPLAGTSASELILKTPLAKGHSYVLRILGADVSVQGRATPADGWDSVIATFSTKGKAQFSPFADESNRLFRLESDVALMPCLSNKQTPVLVENRDGTEVAHDATMRPLSTVGPSGSNTPTARCLPVRSDGVNPIFDPRRVGSAVIALSRGGFQQEKVKLKLKGVFDVLGQEVAIPDKAISVGAVPADKDASTYYLKLAHETGPHQKPAYSADVKLAPTFNGLAWGDFVPTASALVDIGFGKTESSNSITLGAGLTRLFLTGNSLSSGDTSAATLTALRLTTLVNVEGDKTFKDKHNVVVQPVARFYFPFLDHSKARRSRRDYVEAWSRATSAERADLDEDDYKENIGFSGQVSLGGDFGRALGQPTVETDDKSSQVTVPQHGIARLYPQATATLEVYRASVSLSVVPRYLIAPETVGEVKKVLDASGAQVDQAQLVTYKDWQAHAETSVTIQLDRSGHIGFTFAYKRGPQPPTFSPVNTFQSGLSIKY